MTLNEQERDDYRAHSDHFANHVASAVDALALMEDAASSLRSAARLLDRIDAELEARPPGEIAAAQQQILDEQKAAIMNRPVVIVITKPGYDTVRIGPVPQSTAPAWIVTLDKVAEHYNLPQGSAWEIAAYDPALPHEDPAETPTTVPALVPILREIVKRSPDELPDPALFPDVDVRLHALVGEEESYELWRDALMEVDAEIFAANAAKDRDAR
ncbi:hypothetical protein [Nonomuraea candida]|uniref:hypothetical protein n=1 Tax=Nonomuraea candida TaxID=359159 RepID=UPI0005BC73A6|nr:hypothetical protein [Nonomuraea candida]